MRKTINHIYLITLLAILSSIAPVAIDTYIPAIPTMAEDFKVGIDQIELTLSIFLIGFAIGQIFGGVLSDRIGRRKSSIIGLLGFALFSFIIIFSTKIYELWVFRFIEAFFGGFIVVNSTAIVRDMFHGVESAKVLSLIGSVRSIAPLVAPAIGSAIIYFFSWEAIFVFFTLYSLVVTFFINKDLKETCSFTKTKILQSYKLVLTNKNAMIIILVLAFGFSGMFVFITKSSYIYIEHFKISTNLFPLYFGATILSLILLIRTNIRLLEKFKTISIIKTAISIQIVVTIIFMIFSKDISLYGVVAIMSIYVGMNAFIYGNCTALALENFSKNAGVASSVIGVIQFGTASLISSIVVLLHTNSLKPIAISFFIISSIAFFALINYKK